ncbi:MAG: amino acid-binding protein [Dysgonamonadaceae bacterium]|jgi:hypothetical protein|nr:amino acid-binding protein [Dysgonamonadaceae bacterium]
MLIKQLSIFLENKKGRFNEITETLGKENINMTAFTVSENSDFGILRLIVSKPENALKLLKKNNYAVNVTNVICVQMPNTPGALAKIMNVINKAEISIEYMYAFSTGKTALCIIRPDNPEKTAEILQENKIVLLTENELFDI